MRDGEKKEFARRLRGGMTDAEQLLWSRLRRRQLNSSRFRRQHPIGPYIADFACLECRLIVEIDGGQHQPNGTDEARDSWLRSRGFSVLRFWNNDVLTRTTDVLEEILRALASTHPHPGLPPQAGEGEVRSRAGEWEAQSRVALGARVATRHHPSLPPHGGEGQVRSHAGETVVRSNAGRPEVRSRVRC